MEVGLLGILCDFDYIFILWFYFFSLLLFSYGINIGIDVAILDGDLYSIFERIVSKQVVSKSWVVQIVVVSIEVREDKENMHDQGGDN